MDILETPNIKEPIKKLRFMIFLFKMLTLSVQITSIIAQIKRFVFSGQ